MRFFIEVSVVSSLFMSIDFLIKTKVIEFINSETFVINTELMLNIETNVVNA